MQETHGSFLQGPERPPALAAATTSVKFDYEDMAKAAQSDERTDNFVTHSDSSRQPFGRNCGTIGFVALSAAVNMKI
jgi:hypothetical protein